MRVIIFFLLVQYVISQSCGVCDVIPLVFIDEDGGSRVPTTSGPTTRAPTMPTTSEPTRFPTMPTTPEPTSVPTSVTPTSADPTALPTAIPTTADPTALPTTADPTALPTSNPTTISPTALPTHIPTTTTPTTAAPTRNPTTQPSVTPEDPQLFFQEEFNWCTETSTTLDCESYHPWVISSGSSGDLDLKNNYVELSKGVIIELDVDIQLYTELTELTVNVGTRGNLDTGDYCRVMTQLDSNTEIEHTIVKDTSEGRNNMDRETFTIALSGSGTTLTVRLWGDTNSGNEECEFSDVSLSGRPSTTYGSCVALWSQCGGVNYNSNGVDSQMIRCCSGDCIKDNEYYWQCIP